MKPLKIMYIVFLATHERVIFTCVANRPINIVHARTDGGLGREPGRAAGVTQISPKVPTGPTLSMSMILRRSSKKLMMMIGMRIMTELHALCQI